jgi:hypothetical protein
MVKSAWHDATRHGQIAEDVNANFGTINPFHEYIRADLHRAEIEAAVKRAIDACADEVDCGGCYGQCQDPANCHAKEASAIRALASDPAALERIIKGAGNE